MRHKWVKFCKAKDRNTYAWRCDRCGLFTTVYGLYQDEKEHTNCMVEGSNSKQPRNIYPLDGLVSEPVKPNLVYKYNKANRPIRTATGEADSIKYNTNIPKKSMVKKHGFKKKTIID